MPGLDVIFYILILVFSVIIHEIAHGYVADMQGDPTARLAGRLTLNPAPHIDFIGSILLPALLIFSNAGFIIGWAKPVPYNPYNLRNQRWGEAAVASAGVLANLLLAFVFGMLVRFAPELGLTEAFVTIAQAIVLINLVLAVFNLVPVPPLDGSKLLFSIIPYRFSYIQEFMERYAIILIFVLIFVLWNIISPVVSFLFNLLTGVPL